MFYSYIQEFVLKHSHNKVLPILIFNIFIKIEYFMSLIQHLQYEQLLQNPLCLGSVCLYISIANLISLGPQSQQEIMYLFPCRKIKLCFRPLNNYCQARNYKAKCNNIIGVIVSSQVKTKNYKSTSNECISYKNYVVKRNIFQNKCFLKFELFKIQASSGICTELIQITYYFPHDS